MFDFNFFFFFLKEAFKMIQKGQLSPNIRTFGCLAYSIRSQKELDEFLNNLNVNANH